VFVTFFCFSAFTTDGQWLCDDIKFTRWQHPAVGRGARFVVAGSICLLCATF